MRSAAIWLALTGMLIVVIAFTVGNDPCAIRVGGDCQQDAGGFAFIIGMFVFTWAVVLFAAHRIIMELRSQEIRRWQHTITNGSLK
ncbi:hypothetical protein Rhe02_88550 [Rhizocola hellebori]|uniref:Uncharacterized protein n=1 Tax=Rhizocola hellebori TaxID=1392758 RepID=A0A8J3QH58_9ACTN|nr:hypothetical protein [Rhizocola hellebori]GIH10788.1 hypothetical protein Rhe02_88550 [Rhizocola hellebori]